MDNPVSAPSPLFVGPLPVREWISISETADALGVCKRTIYYWIRQGYLETVRINARQRVLVRSLLRVPPRYTRATSPLHYSRFTVTRPHRNTEELS